RRGRASERLGERLQDSGLVGIPGCAGRGVGRSGGHDDRMSPAATAVLVGPRRREVCATEPNRRGGKGVRGEYGGNGGGKATAGTFGRRDDRQVGPPGCLD